MLVGRLRERAGLLSHFLFYPRCCVNLSFLSFPSNLLEHSFLLFLGLSLTKEQRGEIIELVLEGKRPSGELHVSWAFQKAQYMTCCTNSRQDTLWTDTQAEAGLAPRDPALLKSLDKIVENKPVASSQELTAALRTRTGRRANERSVEEGTQGSRLLPCQLDSACAGLVATTCEFGRRFPPPHRQI